MPLLIPWMVVSTIDLILSFVVVVVWLTAIGSVIKPSSLEEVGFDIICLIGGIGKAIQLIKECRCKLEKIFISFM